MKEVVEKTIKNAKKKKKAQKASNKKKEEGKKIEHKP